MWSSETYLYWSLAPAWHRAPKILVTFKIIGATFVLAKATLGGLLDGAGYKKDPAMRRFGTFNSTTPALFSREGRGAGSGVSNWSYLHDEATIKIIIVGGSKASRLVNTSKWGMEHPNSKGTESPALGALLDFIFECLYWAVHLCPFSYPLLYSKLINTSECFPGVLWAVVTNYQTRSEIWEPWFLAGWPEVPVMTWDFSMASKVLLSM